MARTKLRLFLLLWFVPGLLLGLFKLGVRGSRHFYLRRRYPNADFAWGADADEACCFETPVAILKGARISNSTIGRYSYINCGTTVVNSRIGRYCSIGEDVRIGLRRHPLDRNAATSVIFYRKCTPFRSLVDDDAFRDEHLPIEIGHDVWIGTRAIIRDGVKIGHGAVVGAGAVVTRDVPCYAIVAGVPARVIRYRFSPQRIRSLLTLQWRNRDLEWIHANAEILIDCDVLIQKFEQEGIVP